MHRMLRHSLLILVPVIGAAALLPLWYSNQLMFFNFVVFLTLAQGINVIYGFTGYLPFGFVGFFGAGAYFAIANLATALALYQVVSNPALQSITAGPYGISLSGVFNPLLSYSIAVLILAATLITVIYLRNSNFGLSLQAIKDDPVSASMAGINVARARTIAWLASALIAGLIGSDFAWYVSVFYPETVFSTEFSVFAIVFALFGGVATDTGPILGVLFLYGLYNLIGISAPQYFQLIYGVLIVVIVLFLPTGLVSLLQRRGIDVP